ncbi:hypothetical protein BJX64DRAFT_34301 [Aspergillus heterothallicus]
MRWNGKIFLGLMYYYCCICMYAFIKHGAVAYPSYISFCLSLSFDLHLEYLHCTYSSPLPQYKMTERKKKKRDMTSGE